MHMIDKRMNTNIGSLMDTQEPFSSNSTSSASDEAQNLAHQIASIDLSNTRYLPQTQAVLMTADNWKITMANQAAFRLFEKELQDQHVLDFIQSSHHTILIDKIVKAREENKGSVLIRGHPVLISKSEGIASVILWLKEKKQDTSSVFIWIFEPICQSTVKMVLDKKTKNILSIDEKGIVELFDYLAKALVQKSIYTIIPHFDFSHTLFTGCSQLGASFPIIVHGEDHEDEVRLRITSIPSLTGSIKVDLQGNIKECKDSTFSKYMFGTPEIADHPLSDFVPQFSLLLSCLKRDDLLHSGSVLNSGICRSLLSTSQQPKNIVFNRKPSTSPAGRPLPILVALHRDRTYLEIDLQIKINQHSLLVQVTFDRQAVLSRYGHHPAPLPLVSKSVNQRSQSINIPTLYPSFHYIPSSFSISDYQIIDDLGQGAYGIVKLAYLKKDPTKTKVAIKYIFKSRVLVDCWTRDQTLGLVPAEIHVLNTLRKIPHINCSDMSSFFEDQDHFYVVMNMFGAGMDLFDYIEFKKEGLCEREVKTIFRQVMEAVHHLHQNHIIHRDIKDENVVLDLQGGVKLIDFGSATYTTGKQYETFVGTLDYAAPEILRGRSYTGPPQDIWACGALLYTLIYRENPFYNMEEIMERELRLPFVMSQESIDLIKKMLERDVDKRLNVSQVLAHPWLDTKRMA